MVPELVVSEPWRYSVLSGMVSSNSCPGLSCWSAVPMLLNNSLVNGTQIINQGIVHWDSDENGENDANELSDDPAIDDGIDLDNDGETDDDDPTIVIVSSYEPPDFLVEDFFR